MGEDDVSRSGISRSGIVVLVLLVVAGGGIYALGARARAAVPQPGWVLVWSGRDGARYFVDTRSVRVAPGGRHGSFIAHYLPPLRFSGRMGIVASVRDDDLRFDCGTHELSGAAAWRNYGPVHWSPTPTRDDSVFSGAGAADGARWAALAYECAGQPTGAAGAAIPGDPQAP
jgi:hypothetical protein